MKKSIVVFQDKMIIIQGTILFLLFSLGSGWLLYLTTLPTSSSLASIWVSRILFGLCGLCLPVLFIVNPERYFVWYRFSQEDIARHTLFRRKRVILYSDIPYVMHGKFFHGVYWRDYIIFSNRRLKESDLNHINHIPPSDTLIKVRFSEEKYGILMSILPSKHKKNLAAIHTSIRACQGDVSRGRSP